MTYLKATAFDATARNTAIKQIRFVVVGIFVYVFPFQVNLGSARRALVDG